MYNEGSQRPVQPPIDMEAIKRKTGKFMKGGALVVVLLIVALALLSQSFYMLNSGEEAVVVRLGAYSKTVTSPGLQLKIPFIDSAHVVNVEIIHRLQFGYRSEGDYSSKDYNEEIMEHESIMLTGDENLVVADWAISYRIRNSFLSLYKIQDLEDTLRIISESSYRRVVAAHPLDDILTDKKDAIQAEIMLDLQEICDKYESGVQIMRVELQDAFPPEPVNPAFLDVASAREERATKINAANQYANEKIPVARGDAERLVNEAEGYKTRRINEAEGEVARYLAIQAEYAKNKSITKTRLYLEMIQEVLPQLKSVTIVDGDDTIKFLPIGDSALTEVLK